MRFNTFLIFVTLFNFGCNARKDLPSKEQGQSSSTSKLKSSAIVKQDSIKLPNNVNLSSKYKEGFPKELLQFVPNEFEVYSFQKGDLNKDGLSDYILILENVGDSTNIPEEEKEEENESYTPPEPGLRVDLIIRQKDNKLQHHSSNYYLLANKEADLYKNDSIIISPAEDGFITSYSFSGYGPLSIYSNLEFHFQYSKKNNNWYLVQTVDKTGYNSPAAAMGIKMGEAKENNPEYTQGQLDSLEAVMSMDFNKEEIIIETPKNFGSIPFAKFRKSHYFQ